MNFVNFVGGSLPWIGASIGAGYGVIYLQNFRKTLKQTYKNQNTLINIGTIALPAAVGYFPPKFLYYVMTSGITKFAVAVGGIIYIVSYLENKDLLVQEDSDDESECNSENETDYEVVG